MCNRWKLYIDDPGKLNEELSSDEIARISLPKTVRKVNLSGGEPILKKDFDRILLHFIANNRIKQIQVSTMGYPSNKLETCIINTISSKTWRNSSTNLIFTVSLDGVREVHNEIRRVPNAFDHAMRSIEFIKHVCRTPRLNFTISTVVSKYNVEHIPELIEFLKNMNVSPSLCIADDLGFNLKEKVAPKDGSSLEYIKNVYISHPHGIKGIFRYIFSPGPYTRINWACKIAHMNNPKKMPMPCLGYLTTIEPDGDVHPCNYWDYSVGNIRDYNYNLTEVLSSSEFEVARAKIRKGKCPTCWSVCHAPDTIRANAYRRPWLLVKYFLKSFKQ